MIKLFYPYFWQSKLSLISYLLLPISWLYYLGFLIKNYFKPPSIRFNCPTIAIGNISIGGTGKTQLALYLAKHYQLQGLKVCILTKGYGRVTSDTRHVDPATDTFTQVGDEALMMAQYCPVIIYKNINAANKIISENNFDLVIFDDALQNQQFNKDVTIIMIDGLRGFGNGRLLPAGPLREPIKHITASDILILVGSGLLNVTNQLISLNKPILAKIKPTNIIKSNLRYYAFAGIGNPDKFYHSLHELNLNIVATQNFADHYNYQEHDLLKLQAAAKQLACHLITTEKDWIKLPALYKSQITYLKVNLEFNCNQLIRLIDEKIF